LVCQPQLDSRRPVRDLVRDEFQAAPRALVVEEDARAAEDVVALAVVDRDPVAVYLGHAVRAARVEGRRLALRDLYDLAEHLAAAGLVEANLGVDDADGFEHARHAQRGELTGEHGLGETCWDEA